MNQSACPPPRSRVRPRLTDRARTIDGDASFLPAKSPLRDGPMLAGERTNPRPTLFIPVRPLLGHEVRLVNREHVVAMALPPGVAANDPVDLLIAPAHRAARTAGRRATGEARWRWPCHGTSVVALAQWPRRPRHALVAGRDYLVSKGHILSIVELED